MRSVLYVGGKTTINGKGIHREFSSKKFAVRFLMEHFEQLPDKVTIEETIELFLAKDFESEVKSRYPDTANFKMLDIWRRQVKFSNASR